LPDISEFAPTAEILPNHFDAMGSDDEFAGGSIRVASLASPQRITQLKARSISFGVPPRTDSFSFLDSVTISAHRSHSSSSGMVSTSSALENAHYSLESAVQPQVDPLDRPRVVAKFEQYLPSPPDYLRETLQRMLNSENQVLYDILDKKDLCPLSSILQVHRSRKALILCPSGQIYRWVRSNLVDSNLYCPEGRAHQQQALSQIASTRTQVLLCCPISFRTLSLTNFHFIYILKAELCPFVLPALSEFQGSITLHVTPEFSVQPPFGHATTRNPCLAVQCHPHALFEPDYLARLPSLIDDGETTCVIAPTEAILESAFKQISHKATLFRKEDLTENSGRACVATTAVLYTMRTFQHYIFVAFPPSLAHLRMACVLAEKVTVLVHEPTAQELQASSHADARDHIVISDVLSSIFWHDTAFLRVGDVATATISNVDCTRDAFEGLIGSLVRHHLLSVIPFRSQTITLRILTMTEEMCRNFVISVILQRPANVRGQYRIPVLDICRSGRISPVEVDAQLQAFERAKLIEFSYSGEAWFFHLKEQLDDDSCAAVSNAIEQELAREEEEADRQFDVIFSILKNPDALDEVIMGRDPKEMNHIPHEPVEEESIRRMIRIHKRAKLTPRAIARIMHGISSPEFSSADWERTPFWRAQAMASFADIMRVSTKVMLTAGRVEVMERPKVPSS
jgi:hypothetical protein